MILCGIVENIIYKNVETGYTVAAIDSSGEEIVAVGIMPLISEGETIEMDGDYTEHKTYGQQFSVTAFRSQMPANETAILRYLSSGIIKGIGPKTAKVLVDKFGPDTLEILEQNPETVSSSVKGISIKKAEKISQCMKETVGVKTILLYFQQFGITPSAAYKIYTEWGLKSYDIIKQNPYKLCEIRGIGFEKADQIAKKMNFDPSGEARIEAAINYVLNYNMYNSGHTFLPLYKLCEIVASLLVISVDSVTEVFNRLVEKNVLVYVPEIGNRDAVYLYWNYYYEKSVADRVLLSSKLKDEYRGNFARDIALAEKSLGITFESLQKEAIFSAVKERVLLITGGPGTGKTTTLNGIIKIFEQQNISFALAAPTGRAAKRISELTGKEAKTIHRLLEYSPRDGEDKDIFNKNNSSPLKYDAIIIDESSMIDLNLFYHLLDAIPMRAKLILVGDAAQLPPVGAGNVFKDLIESGFIPTVRLTQIFRQAKESLIITNAHEILNGRMPVLNEKKKDFFFLNAPDSQSLYSLIISLCTSRLPNAYGFDPMTDIQVLSPTRKGASGTNALNNVLKDALNEESPSKRELTHHGIVFREGDKVMQIRNNYDLEGEKSDGDIEVGIFNGDMGIIEEINLFDQSMKVRFYDRVYTYSAQTKDIEDLELAYAITVHKSQGSEFDAVVLPLLEGSDLLYTRNLLYTAVTRAKKILIIAGDVRKIQQMVKNVSTDKRFSGLKHWMRRNNEALQM